ncbi:hypothetical protein [Photobacterium sp. TY1-4]|uniref:hypothetical protein n=1 Tax=Photobacterium sp. TY1-4 TaxID=2899122 RepID=UPI0021BF4125|nr:hypothetical protein [Photobacterium sp. TY1-4]UXI02597.1 hypothetical protein NH461_07490 [Photobacterium sp. TY1-4]
MSNNENLFSQIYQQLSTQLGIQYLQMNGTPQNFNWNVAPTGQMDPTAYQMISAMPNWSPVGNFSPTATRFFDAYKQIFSHVTFKVSPEQQQAVTDATNQVTQKQNAIVQANSNMNQAYLAAKQNGGVVFEARYPTINDWLASPEAQSYVRAINDATAAFDQALAFKLQLEKAFMPQSLQNAIDATVMPTTDPASATAPRGWVKVPNGSGILEWQPEFKVGQSGQDWRSELTNGSQGAFTITVDASDQSSAMNHSWAGGSAGYSTFFWGVHGSGGWEKIDLSSQDSSLKAEIQVESSTLVDISPGDWYDGGFLNELANATQGQSGQGFTIVSPWVANGPQGSSSLFGQYGILTTGIVQLLVAYKPSFKVTMSEATYNRNYEKFNGGGGFRIGPFNFGGSGGHESEYIHSTSGNNTFEGKTTSENPVILGVVVSFPGNVSPNTNKSKSAADLAEV